MPSPRDNIKKRWLKEAADEAAERARGTIPRFDEVVDPNIVAPEQKPGTKKSNKAKKGGGVK